MTSERFQDDEQQRFRHQIVLSDTLRYESVKKSKEYELKFHPHRIPDFLRETMRTTEPQRIEQVYVIFPVANKKGKRKLIEGRIRRTSDQKTGLNHAFSVEKKKKRKGVGINGEAQLILSSREEQVVAREFNALIEATTVPKVCKMRYHVPMKIPGVDGTTHFHVDVFDGEHHGFFLIEVEFESKQAEQQFRENIPVQLRDSEVTDIHAFRNSHIAFFGTPKGDIASLRNKEGLKA
ncbi:MAG: hypothetical protein RI911_713 [Candidatus Parcubacteria bacterium]|jgi:CYTH domain-containing protein